MVDRYLLLAAAFRNNDSSLVFAASDAFEESGEMEIAKTLRAMSGGFVKEVRLEDLPGDYDWKEVFGEGDGGHTTKDTDVCPPGSDVDATPPNIADVAEIIAAVNGENDGDEWAGIFRLNDGRFLMASGGCDYTGWD